MKKKSLSAIILFSVCCLFPLGVTAQSMEIDWAVKDTIYQYGKELLCDNDSNIFIYGKYLEANNQGTLNAAGSLLKKFSTSGQLLLMKKWPVPSFSIQKIIYDGGQYFYFTGFFAENCTVDGISILNKGKTDGMIGKMNGSGTILWIKTFGSSNDEMGSGLCFGPSNNSLILSGSITDSLVVNNVLVNSAMQSMLVAQFSLSGVLQNHKLFAFLPEGNIDNYIGNVGREIYSAGSGNYFVLASRKGMNWETQFAPPNVEGHYVMKLNSGFDTLWTKFIIGPECYYGYHFGHLRISADGDPYIPSFCNGKYGGDGKVQRLDQNSGAVTWREDHSDAYFSDIFLEGNTLFTCGTDSITEYGEFADHGYQNIKTFNQQNIMTDIIKFNGPLYKYDEPPYHSKRMHFEHITRDNYGNMFINGDFNFQYVVFGNDTIMGHPTDSWGTYYGSFLLKLKNKTTCTPPPMPAAANTPICTNTAASLSATGTGTLSWYSQAVGGTYLGGGANYITPILTTTTTYYVQDSTCAASSTRKAVLVTVNPLPTVTANASATNVCEGTTVILTGGGAVSYTWSDGISDGQGFVPTTTNNYKVTGTDGNNCSNIATKTVYVNPLPIVTANAGSLNVCEGTSVTLTGGGASSYIWTGGITNGLGFIPAITTTYTVTGTDGNNCTNTATKTINVNPLPIVTANASATSICQGNTVLLTGGGASSYIWTGGITNGLGFIPEITTTYTVTGTDGNNCTNTAIKTIHVNPLPTVTANASATSVCEGSSIVLTGGGAASYTWSDGISDGLGFIPGTTTTYTVTGTDGNNCSNTATKTIIVNPPLDITTDLSGITISANQTGATYQWLNCNNGNSAIAGATDQSYTALINGEYAVMVVMNGCADTSTCVNLNITGINKIVENNNQLIVFPNPNNGALIIQSTSEGDYSIRTELGQTVQLFKLNSANNYTVNIENLSAGIYFIVGFNNDQLTNQKVVVTK